MAAPTPQAEVSPGLFCQVGYQLSISLPFLHFMYRSRLLLSVLPSSLFLWIFCLLSFLCCHFSVSTEVAFLSLDRGAWLYFMSSKGLLSKQPHMPGAYPAPFFFLIHKSKVSNTGDTKIMCILKELHSSLSLRAWNYLTFSILYVLFLCKCAP